MYYNDLVHALTDRGVVDEFQDWADLYYPEASSYYSVLSEIAFARGIDVLYEDIVSGKFEEEMKLAPT